MMAARWRRIVALVGLVCGTLGPRGARAESTDVPETPGQIGNLQRIAAGLEAALDIYRRVLVEVVPAAQLVLQAAQDGRPDARLPPTAVAVFQRLATSMERRLATDALTPVVRAHHLEVAEGLDMLAAAERFEDVLPHFQQLLRGLRRVHAVAEQVADLFDRRRPIVTRVMDPASALDRILEALDEVARAERRIPLLRRRGAGLGEQLQAFLRLDIALGHALDLIAAAEEAGIEMGFSARPTSQKFVAMSERVGKRINTLAEVVTQMRRPPEVRLQNASAVAFAKTAEQGEAFLEWAPAASEASELSAIRIERRNNRQALVEALTEAYMCAGLSQTQAHTDAQSAFADSASRWQQIALLPRGRRVYSDVFDRQTAVEDVQGLPPEYRTPVPPAYRVAAVSPFGVSGPAVELRPGWVPQRLLAPTLVQARAAAPEPTSDRFYRELDQVDIRWRPAAADLAQQPLAKARAQARGAELVERYRVLRVGPEGTHLVGAVPAGTTRMRDRVPLGALARGVRYVVEAIGTRGVRSPSSPDCATGELTYDGRATLALAKLGLDQLERPTRHERQWRRSFAATDARARARARLLGELEPEARTRRLQQWWRSESARQRRAWLQRWPELLSDVQWRARMTKAPVRLRGWARTRGRIAAWLRQQPDYVRAEVDRWWRLSRAAQRKRLLQQWRQQLSAAHARWVAEQDAPTRGAKLYVWWHTKDLREQKLLTRWWREQDQDERQRWLRDWFAELPRPVQESFAWPDWRRRSADARDALLHGRHLAAQVPARLWPRALAWLQWQQLEGAELERVVRQEAGFVGRSWASLRYGLRPLDRALGFQGPTLLVLLLVAGVLLASMRRRTQPWLRPLPGVSAMLQGLRSSERHERPAMFAPGSEEVQSLQTLNALVTLSRLSERAQSSGGELRVPIAGPFAYWLAADMLADSPAAVPVYVAPEQLAYAAGSARVARTHESVTNAFFGELSDETLLLAEPGAQRGVPQVGATASYEQLATLWLATDHVLLGEELFATPAYLSEQKEQSGMLRGQDWLRWVWIGSMLVGSALATLF